MSSVRRETTTKMVVVSCLFSAVFPSLGVQSGLGQQKPFPLTCRKYKYKKGDTRRTDGRVSLRFDS